MLELQEIENQNPVTSLNETNSYIVINIKTLSGISVPVRAKPTDTIQSLYKKFHNGLELQSEYAEFEASSIPEYTPERFIFAGKMLQNEKTLQDYGIANCSNLLASFRCYTEVKINVTCVVTNSDSKPVQSYQVSIGKSYEDNIESFRKKLSNKVGLKCTSLNVKRKKGITLGDQFGTYKLLNDGDKLPPTDLYAEFDGMITSINQINSEINEEKYYQDNKGDNLPPLVKVSEADNQEKIPHIHSNFDAQSSPSGQRSYLQPLYGLSATVGGIIGGACSRIVSSNSLDIVLQRSPIKNPNLTTVAFMVGGAIVGVTIKFGIDLIRNYYATKQQDSGNQSKKY